MAQTWPPSLQEYINEESFSLATGQTALVTDMDVGTPKKRRRFTRPVNIYSVTITIDASQFSVLDTFFNTTLNGGVEQFVFNHPFTGVPTNFRTNEPNYTPKGGATILVAMRWEQMP